MFLSNSLREDVIEAKLKNNNVQNVKCENAA